MTDEVFHYLTVFDAIRCDEITLKGRPCSMVPIWRDKATRNALCFVHAEKRFRELKEAHDASAVHAGG